MNCNECIKANPIERCSLRIYVPDVSGTANGDYIVTITDTSTGRVETLNVTAVNNTLTIDVDELEFMNHIYELRVYEGDLNEPREITIGVTSSCCVQFGVTDFNGDGYSILSLDTCN